MLGRCPGGADDDVVGHAFSGPVPTLVRLSSSRAGAPAGEPLVLAAEVRSVHGQGDELPATGSVVFRVGDRVLGTAALDGAAQAVLPDVRLPPGVHAITAWYGGDAAHARATSSPLPQAVTVAAAPVVLLVAEPADTPEGVRLEAELVDPHTGRIAEDATGSLVFTAGGSTLARVDLVGGLARALVAHLPPGRLLAEFAGDTEHAPATGEFRAGA